MRVKVAGWDAYLALALISIATLLVVLIAIVTLLVLALGRLPAADWPWAVVAVGAAGFGCRVVWIGLRRFAAVEVMEDGTWRLRNLIGRTVGEVAAGPSRTVSVRERQLSYLLGSVV